MSARDAAGSGPKLELGVVNTSVGRHRSPFAASEPRKPAAMRVEGEGIIPRECRPPVSSHGLMGWISPSRPGCRPGYRTYRSGRGWTPSSPRSSPRDSPAARACGGCACRKTRCVRAAETLVVPLAPLRLAWRLHLEDSAVRLPNRAHFLGLSTVQRNRCYAKAFQPKIKKWTRTSVHLPHALDDIARGEN